MAVVAAAAAVVVVEVGVVAGEAFFSFLSVVVLFSTPVFLLLILDFDLYVF